MTSAIQILARGVAQGGRARSRPEDSPRVELGSVNDLRIRFRDDRVVRVDRWKDTTSNAYTEKN